MPGHAGNIHTRCSYGHEHISPRNKYFHGEGRREGGGHWYTYAFCSPLGFGRLEFVLSESELAKGKWFLILIRCGVPRLLILRPALKPGMKEKSPGGRLHFLISNPKLRSPMLLSSLINKVVGKRPSHGKVCFVCPFPVLIRYVLQLGPLEYHERGTIESLPFPCSQE